MVLGDCVCEIGYFSKDNKTCKKCHSACETCDDTGSKSCLSCFSGNFLEIVNSCQKCDSNCLTCSGVSTNCRSCASGTYLMYFTGLGKCCLFGQYLDSANTCQNCDTNCNTCNITSTNCLSCNGNLVLNTGNRNCNCLANQFLDTAGTFCQNCDSNCLKCTENATNCVSCSSTYILETVSGFGKCICPNNQYLETSKNLCQNCDVSCEGCTGSSSNECIKCNQSYSFVQGTCTSLCTNLQYFDIPTNRCIQCSELCETCNGPSFSDCSSCHSPNYLKNGSCIASCSISDYTDKTNNICIECESPCLTCSGITNKSCNSCKNNLFLLNLECYEFCPIGYYESLKTNLCEHILVADVNANIINIDNPYKFLLIFYSSESLNITFQKFFRQALVLNSSLQILDNRTFTYSITPSVNASCFIIEINYSNKSNLENTSSMQFSLINSDSPFLNVIDRNFSVSLFKGHQCDQILEYFDQKTNQCNKKYLIDFSWSYGDETNIILLNFDDLNYKINTAIMQKLLLIISIDGFTYNQNYTYEIKNESNTIFLIFTYQKPVIGGVLLHISLDQSILQFINLENQTCYLNYHQYDIKLQDYYFLSEREQKTINNTVILTKAGAETSTSSLYTSMFLSPGSSVAIRGMLLMNIVQLLKFIDIAYPPNVIAIFRNDASKLFFKEIIINEDKTSLPKTFKIYNIYCSILNNFFDEFFQFCIIFLISLIFSVILNYPDLLKKNKILNLIIVMIKATLIWSLVIMMLISKYLKICVYIFLFYYYRNDISENLYDVFFSLFCFLYIIYLPFHLYLIIREITNVKKVEKKNCIVPDININPKNTKKIFPLENSNSNRSQTEKSPEIYDSTIPFNMDKAKIKDEFFELVLKQKNSGFISTFDNFYDNEKPKKSSELDSKTLFLSAMSESKSVSLSKPPNNVKLHKIIRNSKDWVSINKIKEETFDMKEDSVQNNKATLSLNQIEKEVFEFINEPMTSVPQNEFHNIRNKMEDNTKNEIKIGDSSNINDRNKEIIPIKLINDISIFEIPVKQKNKISSKIKMWRNYSDIIFGVIKYPFILIIRSFQKLYSPKEFDDFSFRYRILLKGIKKGDGIGKYYFILALFRYFLLALVVTLIFEYPLVQICIMEFISFLFLVYVFKSRPFESKIEMIICLINECLINTAFLSAVLLKSFDHLGYFDYEVRMNLGWSIVFTYLILMYSLMFNTIQKIIRLLFFVLKKIIEKIKAKRKIK